MAHKLQKENRQDGRAEHSLFDLKTFALIMGEAVRLGHADANSLVSMKLKRDKAAKKPELTDAEISEIREALKVEPEWMQTAFDISLHTGCRLRETRIPVNCIDFEENKITFPTPKGGEDRAFSVPMPSALHPMLERIRKSKQKFIIEFPFQPSRRWQQFFIRIKKTHLTFHCLRVTYVNRLRRAKVPREAAMRLVNHASELIHQIYQREKVEDVAQWRDAVQFPAEPALSLLVNFTGSEFFRRLLRCEFTMRETSDKNNGRCICRSPPPPLFTSQFRSGSFYGHGI